MAAIGVLSLLIFVVPVLILVFIISAFIKGKGTSENESFEKKIRVIYMYTVIVVSLVMMVGGTITLFNSVMDIILPDTYGNNFNASMVDVFTELSLLVIAVPLFIYHGKKVKE